MPNVTFEGWVNLFGRRNETALLKIKPVGKVCTSEGEEKRERMQIANGKGFWIFLLFLLSLPNGIYPNHLLTNCKFENLNMSDSDLLDAKNLCDALLND